MDGLLTWTEENVGELFACIAYKHLTSVDDTTDNEEAGTQAQEIKVAARNEGIDGRALLHLTMSKNKEKQLNKTHTGKTANKKGSQGALDKDLRTFVVKKDNPKDKRRPKIVLNPNILSRDAQATIYAEAGPARKGRCEPWQFDARNHYIYCGLHRNYYQDSKYRKVIDHEKHNMPYKRRLRHGDPPPEE